MPRKEMEIYSSICYYDRPQIKPLQIVNRDKFPGICDKDCHLLRVICGIFPSMNTLLYINLLITINLFFTSVLHQTIY